MIDHLFSYNSIADDYEQLFPNFQAMVPVWRNRLINIFGSELSKKSILDVGCGIGVQSVLLSEQGFNVTAIDISDKMIEQGRRLAKKHNQNVNFILGDFTKLDTILKSNLLFDGFVCCGSAILHISPEDILKFGKQLYQHSNPGGKGLIEFFNWSLVESEDLNWSPRSHFRTDNNESFSVEFLYKKNKKIITSIILLTRNLKNYDSWQIKSQTEFIYWKYLPLEISEIFSSIGFKILEIKEGSKEDPNSIITIEKLNT